MTSTVSFRRLSLTEILTSAILSLVKLSLLPQLVSKRSTLRDDKTKLEMSLPQQTFCDRYSLCPTPPYTPLQLGPGARQTGLASAFAQFVCEDWRPKQEASLGPTLC